LLFDKTINIVIGETPLSARAIKCCVNQVCSMVKAVVEKRGRQIFVIKQLQKEGKDYSRIEKKLNKPLTKPYISNISAELCSICCDFKEYKNSFNGFISLKNNTKYSLFFLFIKF
jgi:hypothetical protein